MSECCSSGAEAQVSSRRVMMAAPLPCFLHRHTNTYTLNLKQNIFTFFVFRVLQRPQSWGGKRAELVIREESQGGRWKEK